MKRDGRRKCFKQKKESEWMGNKRWWNYDYANDILTTSLGYKDKRLWHFNFKTFVWHRSCLWAHSLTVPLAMVRIASWIRLCSPYMFKLCTHSIAGFPLACPSFFHMPAYFRAAFKHSSTFRKMTALLVKPQQTEERGSGLGLKVVISGYQFAQENVIKGGFWKQ